MNKRIMQRKRSGPPLPILNGLNPSRARLPIDQSPIAAADFLRELIATQRHRHPEDNERALLRRFDAGEVRLGNGAVLTPETVVHPGTDVWFYRIPAPEIPVPYELKVIHHDERLLVVDKPPFLATMPRGQHITETATVRLRRMTGNDELSPAHRLDRLTAGVLVFTTKQQYRGAYQKLFATQEIEKTYEAIAAHLPTLQVPQTWRSHIHKEPGRYQAEVRPGNPNAITRLLGVTALDDEEQRIFQQRHRSFQPLARYELSPVTGKTHQLRVHMWQAGAPILGDSAYPDPLPAESEDFARPLELVARRISFIDPIDGTYRTFDTKRSG